MTTAKRYPPRNSERDAHAKEKRQRRKPAEDRAPVEPIIIKSPSRRYETPDTRPNSQTLANRPPEYGGES